jgi:hypothetical protein
MLLISLWTPFWRSLELGALLCDEQIVQRIPFADATRFEGESNTSNSIGPPYPDSKALNIGENCDCCRLYCAKPVRFTLRRVS